MIIWRGWGVIGVVFVLVAMLIGMSTWSATGSSGTPLPFIGPTLLLAGIGTFLLGRYVNVTSVDTKAAQHLAQRRAQLDELVRSGQFQLAPGMPQPQSTEEAHQQASSLFEHERKQAHAQLSDRHTLFFIPVQWVGLFIAAGGLVATVAGVVLLVTG